MPNDKNDPEKLDLDAAAADLDGTPKEKEDFKFALKALVSAYRPVLEEELTRARAPVKLAKEAEGRQPDCEDDIKLGTRIFDAFFTDDVAVRTLPAAARELLGPAPRWRWCLLHIRCCLILGWLICRRPLSFRSFLYYLRWYWICVRRAVGTPINPDQLTQTDREDFKVIVKGFSDAYKPFLVEQIAAVESPFDLPDDVLRGDLDCFDGEEQAMAIFERTFTPEVAAALLGRDFYAKVSQERWFWFCRCWCLCAIRLGCCLARVQSLLDVVRCLRLFLVCLRRCFRPAVCQLTGPEDCVAEEVNAGLPAMVVPVEGTAAGGAFSHYVLEWSLDSSTWHATDFQYPPVPPGGGAQGNVPVFSGLLAYLDTTALDPGVYFIRMTVHSFQGGPSTCVTQFSLFKKDVRILGVSGHLTLDTSEFDPAARLVETVPALCTRPAGVHEASFGRGISVQGSAFVGGCEDKRIKRYLIDYKPGFETDCASAGWTNFWSVEYNTIWQYRDMNMRKDTSNLTSRWVNDCVVPIPIPPWCLAVEPDARLAGSSWASHVPIPCAASGLYTLRLTVEDTDGISYCDTQRIWVDNRPACAVIRIDAVPACADLNVSDFAAPPDCGNPWPLPLSGIAWDPYIDDTLPLTRPNDNFDRYFVKVRKQGGPTIDIPVDAPDGSCFFGTSRVGNPGGNCDPCDPPNLLPAAVFGLLAEFDLRAVDPICSASTSYPVPASFTIPRGSCCVYTFELWVYDRTKFSGGPHRDSDIWPVKICNDLKS